MPYKKRSDYNRFMKEYMRNYRKHERELIRQARQILNIKTKKYGRKKK